MERRSKFGVLLTDAQGNKVVREEDGHRFGSDLEWARYRQLKLLLAAGEITDLRVHPRFELLPRKRDCYGNWHKAVHYTADFQYVEKTGHVVVEDTKGCITDDAALRMRMLWQWHPEIDLRILHKEDI